MRRQRKRKANWKSSWQKGCHTNWQLRQAGQNTKSLSGKWRSNEIDKAAGGNPNKQSDSWEVKVTGRASRQAGEWGDRWAQSQQQNTPKMHQSDRHTDKHTSVDAGSKVSRRVLPGRRTPPLMLWRRGEVSRYRVLLIHHWGGVLTPTSMQPNHCSRFWAPWRSSARRLQRLLRQPDFTDVSVWSLDIQIYVWFCFRALRKENLLIKCRHWYRNILDTSSQKMLHFLFVCSCSFF